MIFMKNNTQQCSNELFCNHTGSIKVKNDIYNQRLDTMLV